MKAPTSDERREVAERIRALPSDIYSTIKEWEKDGLFIGATLCDEADYSQIHNAVFGCFPAEYIHPGDREELHERLADLIDPTCVYEPTETLTRWDENDHEHETNEPDFDCATFACSRCGYEMLYGDECGWFDTEPPYTPHFKFCPNCSARVLPLKLYDKVVTDDGE